LAVYESSPGHCTDEVFTTSGVHPSCVTFSTQPPIVHRAVFISKVQIDTFDT